MVVEGVRWEKRGQGGWLKVEVEVGGGDVGENERLKVGRRH